MPNSDHDRRLYPRVEVDLPGTIHASEERIDCVVKDLSSTGAGLLLAPGIVVSGVVQLELHSGHLIPGQISWRSGPRCGVKFDNPVVYSSEPPEPLAVESEDIKPAWRRCLSGLRQGFARQRSRG